MTTQFTTKPMSTDQIQAMIVHCDEMIARTKNQMTNMGTRFKIKSAIPKLRYLDSVRRKLQAELDARSSR